MFYQPPGPGYYFSKPSPNHHIVNSTKNDIRSKSLVKKILSNELNEKKIIDDKMEIVPENQKKKKTQLSKTMYELKNDLIKQDFKKVKEAYIRNKYFIIMDKLIKMQELEEKKDITQNKIKKKL